MSREVDERVVQMKFDNSQFERETSRTMNTLQKLKASLNFTGVAKGFNNVASETNIISKNMEVLQSGVNSVKREFSSLEVIGATCLVNITNSAINAGKKITNALTIEPVTTGFQEYETKMGAIQTIMTNTAAAGTTMEQVIDVIDELNLYADKTIYNFSEMTRNIGTFTAAGVGLEDSAMAIQGIANLAAASGSNSQQASTAMYQLSQALAAGTVKLQDWNSVVNAGMGGQLFQNALKDTAREMGIAVDDIIEQSGSFRESLSKGWMTADVLNTTLHKMTISGAKEYGEQMMANGTYTQEMADALLQQATNAEDAATKVKTFTQLWDTLKETAQSGWGKTWELLVGNFDEAKNLFTALNDRFSPLIDKFSDARNSLIESAMGRPSKWNEIIKVVNKAGITTEDFEAKLKSNMQDLNINVDEQIAKYGSLEGFVEGCAIGTDIMKRSVRELSNAQSDNSKLTEKSTKTLEEWQEVVDQVWAGDWGNAPTRYQDLAAAEWDYEKVQALVNKTVDGHRLTLADLTEEQLLECAATDEQREKLKQLIKEMNESGESMDALIDSLYKPKTGRELMIQSVYNILDAIKSLVTPIGQAFKEVFSPITAEGVYSFLEALEKFTRQLILTDEQALTFKNVLKILLNVADSIRFVLGTALRLALGLLGEVLKGMNIDISDFTGSIADATTAARKWIKEHDIVNTVIAKLGPTLQSVGKFVDKWVSKLQNSENLPKDIALAFKDGFGEAKDVIKEAFGGIWEICSEQIGKVFEDIGIDTAVDKVVGIYDQIKEKVMNAITGGGEEGSKPFIFYLFDVIKEEIEGRMDEIGPMIESIFETAVGWFRENVDPGMIIGGYFLMSMKDAISNIIELADKFAAPAESLANMFDSVSGTFEELQANIKASRFTVNATGIFMIAGAVAALAGSLYIISKIPKDALTRSVVVLGLLVGMVTGMMKVLSKAMVIDKESQAVNMASILGVCVAMIALVYAIKQLGAMTDESMWRGIKGAGTCMAMIAGLLITLGVVTTLTKNFDVRGLGTTMLGVGIALLAMVATVKIAGSMDKGTMKRGLTFVAAAMTMIAILVDATRVAKGSFGTAATILAATISMGLMIGLVAIAAQISMRDLKHGLKVMTGIEAMMISMLLITKIGGGLKSAASLILMSAAALLMVGVVKLIGRVTTEELGFAAIFMTEIGIFFAAFTAATYLAGENALKAGVAILAISVACGLMVGVIKLLSMFDLESLAQGIAAMYALGMLISLMIVATRGSADASKNILSLSVLMLTLTSVLYVMYALTGDKERFMLAVGSLMLILIAVFGMIAKGNTIHPAQVKTITKMLTMITVMLAAIAGILYLMAKLDLKNAGENANALRTVMGSLGLCILAISKSMAGINMIDKKSLLKLSGLFVVLIAVMAAVGTLFKAIEYFGVKGADWNLIGQISVLMLTLSVCAIAMAALSRVVDGTKLLPTIAVMAVMTVVMAAVMFMVKCLAGVKSTKGLESRINAMATLMIVLTACAAAMMLLGNLAVNVEGLIAAGLFIAEMMLIMYAVMGVVSVLSRMKNTEGLMTKVLALSALMGVLTVCAGALLLLGNLVSPTAIPGIIAAGVMFAALSVIIYKVVGVIEALSKIENNPGLITKVIALSILMLALAVCTVVLNAFTLLANPIGIYGAIKALDALIEVLPRVAEVISSMNGINGENAYNNALALSKVILAMAVACLILSGVGIFATAAKRGVSAFKELGDNLIELLGTFMDEIGPRLNTFGMHLVLFSTQMALFSLNMKKVDSNAVESCKLAAEMLTALVGATIFDKVMTKFSGEDNWITTVGDKLNQFGEAVISFSDIIAGKIDTEAVNAATNCGLMLAAMEKSMTTKPVWLTWLTGESDMGEFGTRISSFAQGMIDFAGVLSGYGDTLNVDAVQNFCDAVMPLVELAGEIPNEGGWLGKIVGENNIDTFSAKLPKLATNMKTFLERIKDYKFVPSTVQNFCDCVTPLAKLGDEIPNCGGLLASLIGDNALDTFGKQLPELGKGLAGFYDAINSEKRVWDPEVFTACGNCMAPLAALGKEIDEQAEWTKQFVGDNSLSAFGAQLTAFAPGITAIGTALQGASVLRSERGVTMVTHLKSMLEAMPSKSEIEKFTTQVDAMVSNSTDVKLETLGGMLKKFSDSMEGTNAVAISNAGASIDLLVSSISNATKIDTGAITGFTQSLETFGSDAITNLSTAITEGTGQVTESIRTMVSDVVDKFQYQLYNFRMMGWHIIDAIEEGIEARRNKVWAKIKEVLDECVTNSSNYDMTSVGENIINGMIKGMNNKLQELRDKCNEVGELVDTGISGRLEVESPSKVTTRIGEFVGMGLINGMSSTLSQVEIAAGALGDTTSETLGGIIAQTVESFENEDINPVITPVLDLTEVNKGLGDMNSAMDGTTIRARNVTSIGGTGDTTTNGDLLSAINNLNNTLSNLEMNNYSIGDITYDDGSNINAAIKQLITATQIAKR